MPYKDPIKARSNAVERTRRWRKLHPEYYRSATVKRINAAYKERNREKVRIAANLRNAEHPEKQRKYYQMNRDSIRAKSSAYYIANLEKCRAQGKLRWHAKWDKLFGWEPGTHKALWDSASACLLCNVPFEDNHRMRKHTDHDHRTGKFRGIIHHQCNQVLGLLSDSESHALQVAAYLRRGQ